MSMHISSSSVRNWLRALFYSHISVEADFVYTNLLNCLKVPPDGREQRYLFNLQPTSFP